MKVNIIKNGVLEENCYVLEEDNKFLIIDPGSEFNKIKEVINGEVLGVLITHRHFDHIGALEQCLKEYRCAIYDRGSTNEETYNAFPFSFNVIYTPGHTMDSVCFYFYKDKIMFVGDFIFKDSIGRCDLEGGNISLMKESIEKIKKYDDDITIYPGHGEFTTLGREKLENYYFNK